MNNTYKKGEIIRITNNNDYPEIYGKEAVIQCVFEPDEAVGEFYGIFVGEDFYCIYLGDFETTGKFGELVPMSDTSVKVSVSQDGIGKITQVIVDDKEQE